MESSEELKRQYIEAMGDGLGSVFWTLHLHVSDLYLVWRQYEQLFAENEETVVLLNESAPTFFGVIQGQLWDSVMIGISRLTDPAKTFKSQNLTILALPALISDANLRRDVQILCDVALNDAEFARTHRNKRIAHNDLDYVIDRAAHPLPAATRVKIKASLDSICSVLNALNGRYKERTCFYDDVIFNGGAGSLVHRLRRTTKQ